MHEWLRISETTLTLLIGLLGGIMIGWSIWHKDKR